MGKNILKLSSQKKFENRTKNFKDMRKYVKHIRIAKNLLKDSLAAIVVFFKQWKI